MCSNTGESLTNVLDALHTYAKPSLAASWDNEAIDLKSDLIVTYHPLIFTPLKRVTTSSWKERIVAKCLENRIAVYSPHTSFDSVRHGVNDWLVSAFAIETSEPILRDENITSYGMGRFCTLKEKISIEEAVNMIKRLTSLQHVRLARGRGSDGTVKTVAVCAGAGTTVLKGISADLYITGEMLHHDILDAVHSGINVILTNHSDSERGFLKYFAPIFSDILKGTVKVSVSEVDADPLKTV
ncbi:hypothetical protein KM043_010669 [Ampulex compressa]|nr:hypothetical protein KM043_010669 [Ampulex compressa]